MNMAQYTENYSLHQWEAEDPFLRTDFNGDFSKIDAALGRAERSSRANAYNLYNLLLQSQYEGKYTGYKKALLFDGFLDESGIQTLMPGAWWNPEEHRVELALTGAQDYSTPFCLENGSSSSINSDSDVCHWLGAYQSYSADTQFTPGGFGALNAVTLRMGWSTHNQPVTVQVQVLDGEQVLATSQGVAVNGTTLTDYILTFPEPPFLRAHRTYTLRANNVEQTSYARVVREKEGGPIAAQYDYTPADYTAGQVFSKPVALEVQPQQVLAWARYNGGTLTCALVAGEENAPFTAGESRPAQTLDGTACQEQAFRLNAPPVCTQGVAVRFGLTAGAEGCQLYDYGIVFL